MAELEIKSIDSNDKDILCDYYEKINQEGLLSAFLYEDNSLQSFLEFSYNAWIYICFLDGNEVGFTLFNDFKGKSAFFHFCLFEKGQKYALEFGKMLFETVFHKDDLVYVFGLTPSVYRHVFPLLQSVGMQKMFAIPEACVLNNKKREAVFSMISKQRFYQLHMKEKY